MSDHWEQLKTHYSEDGLALFLGAGVSIGSGIPTWPDLICRLMDSLRATGGKTTFHSLRVKGFSLPAITEFIESKVDDEKRFVDTLRECLYRDFPARGILRTGSEEGARSIVDHIQKNNPTLDAVYNLCVQDSDIGLKANPKIHGIINFNLDALMQSYDRARNKIRGAHGMDRCLRTIESPSHQRILGRINCYHPHGYLRFDRHAGRLGREAASRVLAEHEFFEFYNQTTAIFTYTMLYFLRQYHCLFIGMSMTDDNVRRLLFYSKSEYDRSRERESLPITRDQRHFVIMQRLNQSSNLIDFTETTLTALGVRPLWIDDFGEIPEKLQILI